MYVFGKGDIVLLVVFAYKFICLEYFCFDFPIQNMFSLVR